MHYAIIAAGEGSRLAAEGIATPKPLVEINGKPLIKRLADIFASAGAESLTVIVNPALPGVAAYARAMADDYDFAVRVIEKPTPGSMHSFAAVTEGFAEGKMIVTTVDTVFRPDEFLAYVSAFEAMEEGSGAFCFGITSYIDDEKPLYVDVDARGCISAFRDKPCGNDRFVSAGIYGISPVARRVLDGCFEAGLHRMRDFQRALLASGMRIAACDFTKVIDIDHASDIRAAKALLEG